MTVRILPPAREEFLEAVGFYESEAAGLGQEFIDEFERAVALIASNPELGSLYRSDTRRKILRRFPFQIIYEVRVDHLMIVAVAHERKRPGILGFQEVIAAPFH